MKSAQAAITSASVALCHPNRPAIEERANETFLSRPFHLVAKERCTSSHPNSLVSPINFAQCGLRLKYSAASSAVASQLAPLCTFLLRDLAKAHFQHSTFSRYHHEILVASNAPAPAFEFYSLAARAAGCVTLTHIAARTAANVQGMTLAPRTVPEVVLGSDEPNLLPKRDKQTIVRAFKSHREGGTPVHGISLSGERIRC